MRATYPKERGRFQSTVKTSIYEMQFDRTAKLERYGEFDGASLETVRRLGREVAALLGPHRVWMLNSTASGGGVAEMMPRLCALLDDVGLDVRWLVMKTDAPSFFATTKALHNLIHGEAASLPSDAKQTFDEVSASLAEGLRQVTSNDVLVVHDPQPAGVGSHLPAQRRPTLVWRSHIGMPTSNAHTQQGWDFLHPYLTDYERLVFSAQPYVPTEYLERARIIAPGIDPLSHKNRFLRPYKLVGIMRAAGLVDGPSCDTWSGFEQRAQRWTNGRWHTTPMPDFLFRPFILQVSRFDRLKGFGQLIPAFVAFLELWPRRAEHLRIDAERVRCELAAVQLVLAGPDPSGVADDPEAVEVLESLCRQVNALPDEVRDRVHLLRLPMASTKENALMVNALQRAASLAVQNSIREGFGLTASEALWKSTPTIVSNVGGLSIQVRHDIDGRIVQDPCDPQEMAKAMLFMLSQPHQAETMGRSGHMRVRDHFLVLNQMKRWLEVLLDVLASR